MNNEEENLYTGQITLGDVLVIIFFLILISIGLNWAWNSLNGNYGREYATQVEAYNKYCHPKIPMDVNHAKALHLDFKSEVEECLLYNQGEVNE